MEKDPHFVRIPLTLHIGEEDIIDDETFDQASFLKKVAEYPDASKSSCPSPEKFMDYFEKADEIYIVTLSSHFDSYIKQEIPRFTPYFQRSIVGFYLVRWKGLEPPAY